MFWVLLYAAFFDDRRKPDRNGVIFPAFGMLLDPRGQFLRRKLHPGIEFPGLALRDHELHGSAADVGDENFLLHRDLAARELFPEAELLEESTLLRFRTGGGRWPAFDDLEGEKAKQREARE